MRQDAHAATAALPVAGFGHGGAVVALGDARVKFAQIFRDRSDIFSRSPARLRAVSFFPSLAPDSFRSTATLVRFFEAGLRDFHAAFDFFRGHHHLELAVIGFGHFGFGVRDFMLQRFVRFVGFTAPL